MLSDSKMDKESYCNWLSKSMANNGTWKAAEHSQQRWVRRQSGRHVRQSRVLKNSLQHPNPARLGKEMKGEREKPLSRSKKLHPRVVERPTM